MDWGGEAKLFMKWSTQEQVPSSSSCSHVWGLMGLLSRQEHRHKFLANWLQESRLRTKHLALKKRRKLQLTLLLGKTPVALLIVINSGFSSNPSHSAPCTVAHDVLWAVCGNYRHRAWNLIHYFGSCVYVLHCSVVGLYLILCRRGFVSHIVW